MTIEYSTYDPETQELVRFDSYAEACAAADDHQIWLMIDSWPVLGPVPDSFDRLVVIEDGRELRSAVVKRREIESAAGSVPRADINRHSDETYGGEAPLLTINRQNETVQLRRRVGNNLEQYTLLWPQREVVSED